MVFIHITTATVEAWDSSYFGHQSAAPQWLTAVPTSQIFSFVLLLPIVGFSQVWYRGSSQWHNTRTKFHPLPPSGSRVESCGQRDGRKDTRPAHNASFSCISYDRFPLAGTVTSGCLLFRYLCSRISSSLELLGCMTERLMNLKGCRRKRSWLSLRHSSVIYLEGLMKIAHDLSRNSSLWSGVWTRDFPNTKLH
jgi:hypothetical protein